MADAHPTIADLRIDPLEMRDLDALLAFELRNRAWFESMINARDPSFYSAEGVAQAIEKACQGRAEDRTYQYLVWDGPRLVGRVNLYDVRREPYFCAELGYRVDREAGGRGVASKAVSLLLAQGFGPLGLWRVEAAVRPENPASIRVLERNGFRQFGHSRRAFKVYGAWYDRLLFERHRDAEIGARPA